MKKCISLIAPLALLLCSCGSGEAADGKLVMRTPNTENTTVQETSESKETPSVENEGVLTDSFADLGDGWFLVCDNHSFSLYDSQNKQYGASIRYTNWMSGTTTDVKAPLDEDGAVYWLESTSSKAVVMELEHIKVIFDFDSGVFCEERSYSRDMLETLALTSSDGRLEIYHALGKVIGGAWCDDVALDTQTEEIRFICIGYSDMVFGNEYKLFLHSWNLQGFAIFDALTSEQLVPTFPLDDSYAVHGVAADTERDLFLAIAAIRSDDTVDDPPRPVSLYVFDSDGQLVQEIVTSALSKTYQRYEYYKTPLELDGNGYVTIYGSETSDTVFYAGS